MGKRFSTVSDTQRGSQNYMEKRRQRREIEVTRWRRAGIERGERKISFLISTQLFNYLGHRTIVKSKQSDKSNFVGEFLPKDLLGL